MANINTSNHCDDMDGYIDFNINTASAEIYDPITYEKINILEKVYHPRSSISVLRDNNKPYFYNVKTLIDIIERGDGKDPFTRNKFDEITIERIYLYNKCIDTFPFLNRENIDYEQIYYDWKNDPYEPLKLLKAQCFIQPSNLIDMFRSYSGKSKLENRQDCINELLDKPENTWILRNSSVKDTDIQKAYVLSIKKKNIIVHYLIVHKIGYGICFNVKACRSKILDDNEKIEYQKIYPSIIHLIQDVTN